MKPNYTVYKAKVVSVDPPSKDGKRKRRIMISPLHHDGAGPWPKSATPPSWIPTSTLGSGVTAFPDVGQECLVAEKGGNRHIIAFTPSQHSSPYGLLEPHKTPEGGVAFGIQGMEKSFIKLDRKGGIGLYSNTFGQIQVRGDQNSVLIKSYEHKNQFAGGFKHHLYDRDDKTTASTEVYTRKKDNPGFTDVNLGTEQGYPTPIPPTSPPYQYVDKAIVNAGFNEDNSVYKLETRQNLSSIPTGKDVFTKLSLGYQKLHNRWGDEAQYPAGNVIEWTGKKNLPGQVGTFMLRWGKLGHNYKNERTKGEIYRVQVLDGLNNNLIYGNQQTDPGGRGKGYTYGPMSDAKQGFTTSFGILGEIDDLEQKNSLYRQFITWKGQNTELWSKELLGGDGGATIWRKNVGNQDIQLKRELFAEEGGSYTVKYLQDEQEESISIENKRIELKSSEDVSITIDGKEITLRMEDSELKMTPEGLTYNGMGLVFESLVDFIKNNASMLGIDSKAAPVAMHPATQGKFNTQDGQKHTKPKGFRTKS